MTKHIVLEGIWGSPVERFTLDFIKRDQYQFDCIKVGIGASPFNGLHGWVHALTHNMECWRDAHGIALHQRSLWASYHYAKPLAGDDEVSVAEIDLFKNMTDNLLEMNQLPELIVYFHCIPQVAQKNLEDVGSICAEIGEHNLRLVSKSMLEWIEQMSLIGVEVIEIPPPMNESEEAYELWYNSASKRLIAYLERLNGSQD